MRFGISIGAHEIGEPLHFQGRPKEALENPSHSQCSPDAAMAISWLDRRNGGFSEAP
jgi:hypothetical protein